MARKSAPCTHRDADIYHSWLEALSTGGRMRVSTVEKYGLEVKRFLNAQRRALEGMTEESIADFQQHLSLGEQRRLHSALRHFFQYALENQRVKYNPAYSVRPGRTEGAKQLTLMEMMIGDGFTESQARGVRWVTIIPALAQDKKVKVVTVRRKALKLREPLCKRLEQLFRRRIAEEASLHRLLRSAVAS